MKPSDPAASERSIEDFDRLVDSIRHAIVEVGEAAYEDAGIQGLCAEGRWEAAVSAMRAVDLVSIIRRASADPPTR